MTSAIDIEHHPAAAIGFYQEFTALDGGWRTFPRHYLLYASSGVFQLEVAQMHMTWRQLLRRTRMIRAMELLAAGNANVTETVAAMGFDSLSAFVTASRSVTGETPAQYRRRFKVSIRK